MYNNNNCIINFFYFEIKLSFGKKAFKNIYPLTLGPKDSILILAKYLVLEELAVAFNRLQFSSFRKSPNGSGSVL